MKFKTRFGTTLRSTLEIMIRISITYPPICFLFTGAHIEKVEGIGGYVIEILIIIQNVLCNVVPNLVFNFMGKFTTFVG